MSGDPQATAIRDLNDAFRQSLAGGRVCLTAGVLALPGAEQARLIDEVRRFDAFDAGNDPNGEHDFGALALGTERYFWKIDYYDAAFTFASPDPADPTLTRRVMTIMRADEY